MYKVILVDDERVILEGLRHIIKWEEHGLEIVAEALNGVQALEILENTPANILLTDIRMPEMDGLELIRRIKQKGLDIKFVILSGYNDFCYVKEGAKLGIENYILKPINEDELSLTLLNIVEKIELELHKKIKTKADDGILRDNILYRWISNQININDLEERASLLDINLSYNTYIVCLVRVVQPQGISLGQDTGLLRFAVQNICKETIGSYGNGITFNDHNGEIVLLFSGSTADVDKEKVCEILVSCISNIKTFLKTEVFISVGSSESSSTSVYKSYENAKSLMEYSLIFPPGTLFDYEKIKKNIEDQQIAFEVDFGKFKNLIISKDLELTCDFIDDIYTRLTHKSGVTPAFLQNISTEFLFNICNIARDLKIDTNTLINYSDNLFSSIFIMDKSMDISNWLKELATKIILDLKQVDENLNPLVRRVLNYIDLNYFKDISLKTLSSLFSVNSAYLGQLFKNDVGEMFSLYLNKVRIEKAKELLNKTDLNAKEVSIKVGYSNENHFYNTFRKLTGKYPTEYKRSLVHPN